MIDLSDKQLIRNRTASLSCYANYQMTTYQSGNQRQMFQTDTDIGLIARLRTHTEKQHESSRIFRKRNYRNP